MKFTDSKYSQLLEYKTIEFSFGTIYTTKQFIISELNEGIHVDYDVAGELIGRFTEEIRNGVKIGYIANRINSYSFDPQLWLDFNNEYDFLIATAIVSYTNFSYINSSIEKHFFQKSLKRCHSLEEAIEWMLKLEEFKSQV
ncbi:hypothetical protein SAMN04515667_1834 [Formosa sp. Hel1_31_208]|uniref:hypothetical protein n=1 Tax=Formosa sp. Hel1_31_208 TaxID=1798225 RepID=UPI000879EA89|nr:hypothetical protein [Formosa sp. Hel1_31_208]SDS28627.1 hypothetical protein SAMN04515667_1834 [Formosa sp. Hel1_31_208]